MVGGCCSRGTWRPQKNQPWGQLNPVDFRGRVILCSFGGGGCSPRIHLHYQGQPPSQLTGVYLFGVNIKLTDSSFGGYWYPPSGPRAVVQTRTPSTSGSMLIGRSFRGGGGGGLFWPISGKPKGSHPSMEHTLYKNQAFKSPIQVNVKFMATYPWHSVVSGALSTTKTSSTLPWPYHSLKSLPQGPVYYHGTHQLPSNWGIGLVVWKLGVASH